MKNITPFVALCVLLCFVSLTPHLRADKPDWQKHIDWAIGNYTTDPGETNCPGEYLKMYPECLRGGGRACLMAKAIDSAKNKNFGHAFRLTLITQCHNQEAQRSISDAGEENVGNYLLTK